MAGVDRVPITVYDASRRRGLRGRGAVARRFCENCGAKIGETARFCPSCGVAQKPNPEVPNGSPLKQSEAEPKRRSLRIVIAGAVLIAALAVLGAVYGVGGGSTSGPGAGKVVTDRTYAELATDPEAFRGADVHVTGRIFRNPEVRGGQTTFQMFADPENSEWNTVVHTNDPPANLASGDMVRVEGKVQGAFEGENAFGTNIRAPEVQADNVVIARDSKGKPQKTKVEDRGPASRER